MRYLSKVEVRSLLARYDSMTHDEVFSSGWKQRLVEKSYKDCDIPKHLDYKVASNSLDVMVLYLALNTLCDMFQDITGLSGNYVATYIKNIGIIEYIKESQEVKKSLIEANLSSDDILGYRDLDIPYGHPVSYMLDVTKGIDPRIFTFLNWLKRVPFRNLNFRGHCVDKFLKNQDRLGSYFSRTTCTARYKLVTEALSYVIGCLAGDIRPDGNVFILPPGQILETVGEEYSYLDKFELLGQYSDKMIFSDWKRQLWSDHTFLLWEDPKFNGKSFIPCYNLLRIVPKDYKQGRTICIETVYNSTHGYCYAEPLTKRLNRIGEHTPNIEVINEVGLPEKVRTGGAYYNHQRYNQLRALDGSRHLPAGVNIATIDLSMASDSNARVCMKDILPAIAYNYGEQCRSKYVNYGTKDVPRLIEAVTWMTMGHPMTYAVESTVFFSAAVLATLWGKGIDPFTLKRSKHLLDINWNDPDFACISACGDDITIASRFTDELKFILETLGHIFNDDKSYWGDSYYRESCGKEYYDGYDVTGLYYPRGTSTNEFAELIGLQHKLIDFPMANAFIIDEILNQYPHTTHSPVGSIYSDIWVPGIGRELVKSDKPRSFSYARYDLDEFAEKICDLYNHVTCDELGVNYQEHYIISDVSYDISLKSKDDHIVDRVENVGLFKVKCNITLNSKPASASSLSLIPKRYLHLTVDIRDNAKCLTEALYKSDFWRHDFLCTHLRKEEANTFFVSIEALCTQVMCIPGFVMESKTEAEHQNDYCLHTSVVSRAVPQVSESTRNALQNVAYKLTLAKTRSHDEAAPWFDPTRILDKSNIIESLVRSSVQEIDVTNKEFLY